MNPGYGDSGAGGSRGEARPLAWLALLALTACAVTLVFGLAAALTYTDLEGALRAAGFTLQHFRPIHATSAFAWVFLGGVAIVYLYMYRTFGPFSPAVRRRIAWHAGLWAAAGIGIVVTLLGGRFSGREYLGYHPVFAGLIVAGWILFVWNFFGRGDCRLRGKPAYVYMWSVGIPFFLVTYTEGHLYLLDFVSERPLRDLAIQWKSAGTMVGSFNLLAYGSLMYISGCISGNERYAHSRTAFALFFIGLLNTFTNYGHHTYHLPQSPWIHWVSFVVSMLETIILAKVFLDLIRTLRKTRAADRPVNDRLIRSGTLWTFLMLVLAIGIAIPPLNALIHGTHVVVAHSMGAMIGIDSMILWAALTCLLEEVVGPDHPTIGGRRFRVAIPMINVFLLVFLLAYLARGAAVGWARYLGAAAPDPSPLLEVFPLVMVLAGVGLAVTVLWMILLWMGALIGAFRTDRRGVS
jgi:nitric oxide reductase subunit B